MHTVRLSEAAAEELDSAYRWYESQREGLGEELLGEFLGRIRHIAETPLLYPPVGEGIRRAPLHRFPYGVFYRVGESEIDVVAFFHGKRDPRRWKGRR